MLALTENSVTGLTTLHTRTNALISQYISMLEDVKDLGPAYQHFPTFQSAQHHLLHYRMKKKWSAPLEGIADAVRDRSIADVVRYDQEGPRKVVWDNVGPFERMCLYRVRNTLATVLKRSYRFVPARLRMPSGEGFTSAKGDCSVLAKLRASRWDITADCVDLFATVCYNVPALKAAARSHIGKVSKDETRQLYLSYGHLSNCGYHVFKELLLSEVLNIVPGCRVETVPKELDKFRVISCEPFCNMIVQSVIEEGLRDVIHEEFGLDLDKAQDLHRQMIRDLQNATIDFSNASNSNWLCWIEWLYPTYLVDQIRSSRSSTALIRYNADKQLIEHSWNMVSPMGNGFTFGLMTLTLLAIARELDTGSSVFGDDVIIDSDVAAQFISIANVIGFRVNEKKTFLEGSFRESCGGFTYQGDYLQSFEFRWANNSVEAIVNVNKVQYLAHHVDYAPLRALAAQLLNEVPALCKRGISNPEMTLSISEFGSLEVESRYVPMWNSGVERKRRHDPDVRAAFEKVACTEAFKTYLTDHQYKASHVVVYVQVELVAEKYRCRLPAHNANAFWTGHFLYAGRCSAPTYRPTSKRPLRARVTLHYSAATGGSVQLVSTSRYKHRAVHYTYPKLHSVNACV